MRDVLLEKIEIISEYNPANLTYLIENTSTTLISPNLFNKYCVKHIQEFRKIFNDKDRKLVLHMCGFIKKLLPNIYKLPAMAIETVTSPPLGDTNLSDGKTHCSGKSLIGGTNALMWIKISKEIIKKIQEGLDLLPNHRRIV